MGIFWAEIALIPTVVAFGSNRGLQIWKLYGLLLTEQKTWNSYGLLLSEMHHLIVSVPSSAIVTAGLLCIYNNANEKPIVTLGVRFFR